MGYKWSTFGTSQQMCAFPCTNLCTGRCCTCSPSCKPFHAALVSLGPSRDLAVAMPPVSCDCCSACWVVPAHLFPGLPALHCSPTCCPSLSCCLCGQAHNGSLGCGFQPHRDRALQAVWMKCHPKSGVSCWEHIAYPTLLRYASSDTENGGKGS